MNDLAPYDFSQLAKEAYDSSTTYFDSNIRKQVEAAIRQFQGVHPVGSKYHSDSYKNRSRLFRPKTRGMVRRAEAVAAEALFSTADVISCKATDDNDPQQKAGAALIKGLMEYRLDKSIPWFLLACGAYQDALVVGSVVSYQYWDYRPKKGIDQPAVELMALENFRFDPGASWMDPVNTSPYNIRRVPMFVKDVKARIASGKWAACSDAELLTAAGRASDTTRQARERGRTDSTQNATSITNFTVVWVHQIVMEIDEEDLVWWVLDGSHKLLTNPVPIAEIWAHGKRPFVMGFSVIETHKSYPEGAVGITKDVQAEINEVTNGRIDNVKFAMNKRFFVRRNGQVDLRSITRNVPGSATLVNDVDRDVKVMDTPDVTSSSYQEHDRLNLDFDEVAGTFSPNSVQSNRKLNETVGGMQLLSVNTNQVGAYQLRTFTETWAEPVLRQLAELEAWYETDEVILRIAGQTARLEQEHGITEITEELLMQETSIRIDVGMGATNPQEQVNNFMTAMRSLKELLADGVLERYGLRIGEITKELFGKLGYRDGRRFFEPSLDPALVAAQNTISELQQALERKVDPEMVAAQIRKLDAEIEALGAKKWESRMNALESALRGHFAASQTAQVIGAVPALAPVADSVLDSAATMSGNEPTAGAVGAPAGPVAGLTQGPVKDPRIGIEFDPAAGGAMAGDTSPQTPGNPGQPSGPAAPAQPSLPALPSPAEGTEGGINTTEADQ